MILARCPACSTTFRVRPEQLSARHGRVRCGQCQHAFNALENQIEEEALADDLLPGATQPPAGGTTTSLFVLQEKQPDSADTPPPAGPEASSTEVSLPPEAVAQEDIPAAVAESASIDETSPTAPITPPLPEASTAVADTALDAPTFITFEDERPPPSSATPIIPELADERIEPVGEIRLDAPDERPDADLQPAIEAPSQTELQAGDVLDRNEDEYEAGAGPETPVTPFPFKPDWPDASELDLKSPPDPSFIEDGPLDFDSLLHKKVGDDTPGMPQQALDESVPAAPAAERPPAGLPIEPPTAAAKPDEPELEQEQDEQEPFADEIEESPGPSPLQQAAWAAGATLLVLALLAQSVLVFRSEIAQSSPQMRLFMESVCAGIGCELPLPRESASITIESSDIQPDANREAFFTLHATLRNRADFAQTWPHLEITLTDARDKALVRRVLEPKQWLPSDMPQDAFPARKEVATQVRFEAPGVAAAGYRVYAFYP